MELKAFEQWFAEKLQLEYFCSTDSSLNGMQVGRTGSDVRTAAFAVDASLETFTRAVNAKADILVVHHGLFWGRPLAVTGSHFSRIKYLIENDLALFAAHLPLDAHPEVGNNACIAGELGLQSVRPFGEYHGQMIGCKGMLSDAMSVSEVLQQLGWDDGEVTVLPFGPDKLLRGGIVSGGAAGSVYEAIDEALDFFITGEMSHQVYHYCLESGITMIAGGHYRTEVYGVRKLAESVERETGIQTLYIDVPTGL